MIITIDGTSGTGKTTVAKRLAEALGITYFDTGAMYRAFAYFLLKNKVDIQKEENIIPFLSTFDFTIKKAGGEKAYFIGDEDVSSSIRTVEVTQAASITSAFKSVREHLLSYQRLFAEKHDSVFEGRDLGTVVFPHADYKIFLFASPEVRAKRRHQELKEKNGARVPSFEEVLQAINERDHRDSTRMIAPLKCPEGAFQLDTSHLSIDEVVSQILQFIQRKPS